MGIETYIQSQLSPSTIALDPNLTQQLSQLETLNMSPPELVRNYQPPQVGRGKLSQEAMRAARQKSRRVMQQALEAKLMRSVSSPRQLEEVMADFWYNHFNVFGGKGLTRVWTGAYEQQAIRPYALGRFRELLGATSRHPAMLFYLDNWQNTAPNSKGARGRFKGLNENYARELMELHTLGVNGGYTQQDVIALAKIFTGWGLQRAKGKQAGMQNGFYFDADRHDFSDKVFLGKTIKGSGMAEGEQALDMLARSPITARRISYQLAQYFVADRPPQTLVDKLSQQFQATDGDIRAVLNTLVHSAEFRDPKFYNAKFKTPYQYVISAMRATGVDATAMTSGKNLLALYGMLKQWGMAPYGCISPDGYKNTQEAWLNPDALLRRITFATALANGRFNQGNPVDTAQLTRTLGNNFSDRTKEVLNSSPAALQASLILGSPELMRR